MYAKPDEIRAYLDAKPAKPFILCEYMHDMGNSLGGMESYIRLARNTPSTRAALCGTTWTRPSGSRACRAAVWAMAATLESAPPTMRSAPTHRPLQTGRRSPPCRTCATGTTPPPVGLPGTRRMPVRAAACTLPPLRAGGPLTVVEGDVNLGVQGEGFALQFSYTEGGLASLRKGDTEWIWRAPRPALWRAPPRTTGAAASRWPAPPGWRPTPTPKLEGWTTAREPDGSVRITYTFRFPTVPEPRRISAIPSQAAPCGWMPATMGPKTRPNCRCSGCALPRCSPAARVSWDRPVRGDLPRPV